MQAHHQTLLDSAGNVQAGVSITVRIKSSGAAATIYDVDEVGISNPITTDANGEIHFKAANGEYELDISGRSNIIFTLYDRADEGALGIWNDLGHSPTYVTSETFTIATDVTAQYLPGLKVKLTDSSTIYGEVLHSTYSAPNTTVTIAAYAGATLSASLSAVEVSIIKPDHNATLLPHVDVREYGALGDGVTDDSAAIQAALDYVATRPGPGNSWRAVYFPCGKYQCNSLNWDGHTPLIGENPGQNHSTLRYNGNGAAGSYLIKITSSTTISWPTVRDIVFDGWDNTLNSGKVSEHIFKNTNLAGVDLHFALTRCSFMQCWGDALDFNNTGGSSATINLHLDRIRFDSVGGFAMKINGASSSERRPVTLSKFSYDNNAFGNFATTVQTMGHFDGSRWGKGVVHLYDPRGIYLSLVDGRIEINDRMIDVVAGKKALIYCDDQGSGALGRIAMERVYGYVRPNDGAVVVYDPGNRIDLSWDQSNIGSCPKLYEGGTLSKDYPISGSSVDTGSVSMQSDQRRGGIVTNGVTIESRTATSQSQYLFYKQGDRILKKNAAVGDNEGWVATAPTTGHAFGVSFNITTSAIVTASSATIDISGDQNQLQYLGIGLNIKLVGAGVAAADLDTYITSVDGDAGTFVVNDTPSTSVNPATISSILPTWSPYGQVHYRSGSGTPSGFITPKFIGEEWLDTTGNDWYKAYGTGNTHWKVVT